MSEPAAIETEGLVKSFAGRIAVNQVDLHVPQGTIYGLLGPNGAGKTTIVRLLATLLRPDGGRAQVLGYDVMRAAAKVRANIALTGQFASVDEDLTGRENLILFGRLLGLGRARAHERAGQLLGAFGLTEAAGRQVRAYSGGMRRRLDIAASLIVSPRVMFLDEPTTGLDPRSRFQVWDLVRGLAQRGTTVLLTTQYLEEADRIADRIAVVDHGRIIAAGTVAELKARVRAGTLTLTLASHAERERAFALIKTAGFEAECGQDRRLLSVALPGPGDAIPLIAQLTDAGVGIAEFSFGQPSLDDVFFALTGHAATPGATTTLETTT